MKVYFYALKSILTGDIDGRQCRPSVSARTTSDGVVSIRQRVSRAQWSRVNFGGTADWYRTASAVSAHKMGQRYDWHRSNCLVGLPAPTFPIQSYGTIKEHAK